MIVVDASSLAKYVIKEEGWETVESYLMEEQCLSVDHVVKEVLNALWKAAVITRVITLGQASEKAFLLRMLIKEGVVAVENELEYVDKAFSLAIKHRLTLYDALYIAQALAKNAVLLTSDKRQVNAAEKAGLKVIFTP